MTSFWGGFYWAWGLVAALGSMFLAALLFSGVAAVIGAIVSAYFLGRDK